MSEDDVKTEVKDEIKTLKASPKREREVKVQQPERKRFRLMPLPASQRFSALSSPMCDEKYVDDVCTLIGSAACKWGYLESEIIYVLSKRLEVFFRISKEWKKPGKSFTNNLYNIILM